MTSFVFNITNRCNFKCSTCLREHSSDQDLDFSHIKEVMPTLKNLGVQHIAITGGEPILHPHFDAVLELITENSIDFSIVTNCWLYKRYIEVLERFKEHVSYIAVSLDGHTAELHDQNRVDGSFKRSLEAIKAFSESGYSVRLSYIVNNLNYGHFVETFRFIKHYDLEVNVGRVIATDSNREWQISPKQTRTLPMKINSVVKGYKQKITPTASLGLNSQLLFCTNFSTMRDVTLRFDGKVSFCCDSLLDNEGAVMGDLNHDSFPGILNRFGDFVAKITRERIDSLIRGDFLNNNDCDFCNRVLKESMVLP